MDLLQLTALQLAEQLHSGKVAIKEVLDAFYAAIEEKDAQYHCYITLCKEEAYQKAQAVQARLDRGEIASPLAGVPFAAKDNICTEGIRTTCASRTLEDFVPTYSAHVMHLLEDADMILLGKTNMDEFAMGATTETSYFGPTRNPRDPACVPGGSSGGSAAAVAAKEAPLALGTDTGGSIRQPCAYCGVTGLKPTYGSVSRNGVVPLASSLDQVGPIGNTALDCAALYQIIRSKDAGDATSMDCPEFSLGTVRNYNLVGKKIGIPKEYFAAGLQPEVALRVREAAAALEAQGAIVEEFSLPIVKYAISTYYIVSCAEASSNLSRYDGIKFGYRSPGAKDLRETYLKSRSEGFGMEVKRRIMLGNFVLSSGYYDAYYKKALQAKRLIQNAFAEAFARYDVILGPVSPTTAPKLGGMQEPLKMYLGDIYTAMVSLAGLPALSLPCGTDEAGLPVGLQLIGKPLAEEEILGMGHAYQTVCVQHTEGGDA